MIAIDSLIWSFYVKQIVGRALRSYNHNHVFQLREWKESQVGQGRNLCGTVLHGAGSPVSWPHPHLEDLLCAGPPAGDFLCVLCIC